MKEKAKLHVIILGCKIAGVFFVDIFLLVLDKIINQEGPKNKWFILYTVG